MALTRGSRSEHAYPRGVMREWGRRTLSFSGGLVSRLRTRSSTPPRPGGTKTGGMLSTFPISLAPASLTIFALFLLQSTTLRSLPALQMPVVPTASLVRAARTNRTPPNTRAAQAQAALARSRPRPATLRTTDSARPSRPRTTCTPRGRASSARARAASHSGTGSVRASRPSGLCRSRRSGGHAVRICTR